MARRSQVWIAALIELAALGAWAQTGQQQSVEIYVYNQAKVSGQILSQAERDATRVLRLSGIQISWVHCATAEDRGTDCDRLPLPGDAILQIVHDTTTLKGDVFGATFLGQDGTGQYADVFYDRVNELHRDWKLSLSDVLGHVVAHEIGHLLLGINSHSTSGIMRGFWDSEELKAAERGRLLFSFEQAELMRARLNALTSHRKNMLSATVRDLERGKP